MRGRLEDDVCVGGIVVGMTLKNVSFQAVWNFLSGIFIFFDKKSENCFFCTKLTNSR